MIIGIPKELKNSEYRVAVTPAGAGMLVHAGHEVLVERSAGVGSGFPDDAYLAEGAVIVSQPNTLWERAELIVKVKEPQPEEYGYFRPGLAIFTYLHLAAEPELARQLTASQVTAIAYETIQHANGSLPLLTPMSEIAGKMAVQIGAQFLEAFYGGQGVLLGGVPGVAPAEVVVLGGGIVGLNAARIAAGMGANVTILERSPERMRVIDDLEKGRIRTLMSDRYNISLAVQKADLLIGAVLITGAKAPKLVTEDMVRTMRQGAVIVDVAVDQGGTIATIDRVTTHQNPVYVKHGVLHYAVANIPGAVPRTATLALTNVTMPYVLALANQGIMAALRGDAMLAKGLNACQGHITHPAVGQSLGLPVTALDQLPQQTLESAR